jgi:GNAT superfamily N-acetyltransferase
MGEQATQWRQGEYAICTDRARLDLALVHGFLTASYWAKGIPLEIVRRSAENSLCFGLYRGAQQIGFARVVTDYATFAYLGDVFILEEFRGRGLSKWLMQVVFSHPNLQGLRRWHLATRDAHGLYRQFGFTDLKNSSVHMEKWDPEIYSRSSNPSAT